jgi:hypothetical protein
MLSPRLHNLICALLAIGGFGMAFFIATEGLRNG